MTHSCNGNKIFHQRKCEYCGKEKIIFDSQSYVYKAIAKGGREVVFCCWNCKVKWQRENPDKVPKKYLLRE